MTTLIVNPPIRRRYLLVCPERLSPYEAVLAGELASAGELWIVVPGKVTPGGEPPPGTRVVTLRALRKMRPGWQPDFVVYASAPSPALHWKIWWWKRRRARHALLGGHWPVSDSDRARTGRWRRRARSWAVDSLDFRLAEDEATAERAHRDGMTCGRIFVTGSAGTLPVFLENRRRAEDRSVLWVDDDLSLHSPSTKHLVYSIPYLRQQGWEVRGWCLTADETARAGAEIHEFPPAPRWLRLFSPYWFFARVNLHGIRQTALKGRPPARIVQSVGSAFLGADIAAIHFAHHVWLRKQLKLLPQIWHGGTRGLPKRALRAGFDLLWTTLAMGRDQLQYRNPRCRLLLPVSDSIAAEVRRVSRADMRVEVLPNTYDETRFNPETRARWRDRARGELGFADGDFVFCFASQGHYRRKGFWLAVDALQRLRGGGKGLPGGKNARLLVVGGNASTLDGLRRELAAVAPGWEQWITFTGTQAQVERFLSAADALLFPSYFEAFCLAEIEAGALGLPLLLTPHPGTEMILRDGVNGLRLSDDPAKLAAALRTFLENGLAPFAASPGRGLERAAYGRALADIYQRELDA